MGLPYALAVELIGSFVFFSVILASPDAFPVAVALLAAVYFGGHISGGNFNPAVTVMMMLRGDLSPMAGGCYMITHLVAAIAAFAWSTLTMKAKVVKQIA